MRAVALFEAAKGTLVLLAGLGALELLHRDLQTLAEAIVGHFHLNPASGYPQIFVRLASSLTDQRLWLLALAALAYATLRLAEGYGLWFDRRWANWLAVGSGGLYVPIEVVELVRAPTSLHAGLLLANLVIVAYLGLRMRRAAARARSRKPPEPPTA